MAFGLVSNNGTHNYNYQEFVCDAPADISKLSKDVRKKILIYIKNIV